MVLNNANNVEHLSLGFHHTIDHAVWGSLIECFKAEELVGVMECVRSPAHIPLIVCTRGKIPSPEGVLIVRVGEHVVVLGAPHDFIFGNRINVH